MIGTNQEQNHHAKCSRFRFIKLFESIYSFINLCVHVYMFKCLRVCVCVIDRETEIWGVACFLSTMWIPGIEFRLLG